ncbi:MAG: sulfotransferase domain-containing protein [Pseudomonadota bacterium]
MTETTAHRFPAAVPPADRPKVPVGKRMLFCVGAQKAGTTWLSKNLSEHPDCHFYPFEKELHYFDTAYGANPGMKTWRLKQVRRLFDQLDEAEGAAYADLVHRLQGNLDLLKIFREGQLGAQAWMFHLQRGSGDARYLCDFTPDYAYCPFEAFEDMASYHAPDGARPKFVFLMRDPVDRHWSFLRMLIRHRDVPLEHAPETLRGWLQHDVTHGPLSQRNHCNYAQTVAYLEQVAPAQDVLVMFYEDMFEQKSYDRVCDFLGIARRAGDFSAVHEGIKSDFPDDMFQPLRESLAETYEFAFERWGDAVPERWRRAAP